MDQATHASGRDPHDERPDPDALLARIDREDRPSTKGQLKIFFGYSAGVGKTYAMLSAARALEMKRGDVLVGYVEPHGRPETEALILGLDLLPSRTIEYRGITLKEFDLEAALERKPKLLLVDELAHTNAEGCTHPKRWQDVFVLLGAGIDVYTTLNVQHLESLNDVVGKITGITVRETVPDSVFDRADEVELVDLPPDELLERFQEGKVYLPDQASRAVDRFFRKETLVALRELALRRTAEHVNRQVELGRRGLATRPIWATCDRLMVAVGPSPSSARLIRATRRMATELRAPWFAVAVQKTTSTEAAADSALERHLQLAERLGAEVVTVHSDHAGEALVRFARDRGVTRLVVGKTRQPWWRLLLRRSIVDDVIRRSGDLDVLVIRGDAERARSGARFTRRGEQGVPIRWMRETTIAAGISLGALLLALAMRALGVTETNIVLVFVLNVAVVAYLAHPVASIVAAVLAVALFNFFFTTPMYTFDVHDTGYVVTFAVMLIIGLVISRLVGRVRMQERAAGRRADASDILFRSGRRLGAATGSLQIATELHDALSEHLKVEVAVFIRDPATHELSHAVGAPSLAAQAKERAVADWVYEHAAEAGCGTDTLPTAQGWYLPMASRAGAVFGVVGVVPTDGQGIVREGRQIVTSITSMASQCLERESLMLAAQSSAIEAESERFRSDLLATVSHDLRTPLATIGGGISAVLHSERSQLASDDREMLVDAMTESERLTRLIENLLSLSRVEVGHFRLQTEWQPIEELIEAALKQAGRSEDTSRVVSDLPSHPLLLRADGSLMTQVFINLIENALRYAPEGRIEIRARPMRGQLTSQLTNQMASQPDGSVRIEILDEGPGFGGERPDELFGRFVRGADGAARSSRGSGLGLAICRAVVQAHGGVIQAMNRPEGGAMIRIDLPHPCAVPQPDREIESAGA